MKKILIVIPIILTVTALYIWGCVFFGPVNSSEDTKIFIVPQKTENFDVAQTLYSEKFIINPRGFKFLLDNFAKEIEIKPGGYYLRSDMNAWQVLNKIIGKEDLKWLTISYCLRKEQIGEILAETLGWNNEKLENWNSLFKDNKTEYYEGVYYPDTYLLPVDESPSQISERFINRFNEKFEPLSQKYIDKNIRWITGIKIASLIAREAAGQNDMKLISGIIWNRLNTGMRLQIDATMQYTLGKNDDGGWWGNIDLSEKQKDSPYNSYLYEGLPPTPICSPNIDAIKAALEPEETECLFYLHDSLGTIHCAKTYKEHLSNIDKYL